MLVKELFNYFRIRKGSRGPGRKIVAEIFETTRENTHMMQKNSELIPWSRAIYFDRFMRGEEGREELRQDVLKDYGDNYPEYDASLYEEE